MRWRGLLAAVLIAVAIRCVPGQPGIINVGAVVPPMPLKTTPETYDGGAASKPTFTPTPSATPRPTPSPLSTDSGPEPLIPPPEPLPDPPVPDRTPMH